MRSIRTKITILSIVGVSITLTVATVIGAISIAVFSHESSEQTIRLICQEGKHDLDDYVDSVEQSANTVAGLIEGDLKDADLSDLTSHVAKADNYFKKAAEHTDGVATYYYRFDPEVTNESGFWYVDEGRGLVSHQVSDITKTACLWFYTPKQSGKPEWLMPYNTDSLDNFTVISYNVPIYQRKDNQQPFFVGVAGIEIRYSTFGEQIKDLKAMDTGFAFMIDSSNAEIIYHPYISEEDFETPAELVEGLKKPTDENGGRHIEYTFNKVKKHCYVLPLKNKGTSIVVCVPDKEVSALWQRLVTRTVVAALVIIAAAVVVSIVFAKRLTKPLKDLTMAAEEINKGNYSVKLESKGNDEIGVLTTTVNNLMQNLGGYINDLNVLAYADALTMVRNRSAYEIAMRELQKRIDDKEDIEFAIALFDCDDLKGINDEHGHDKGNVYLRNTAHLICRIFENSVVYRVGGDEFVVILQDEDYKNRKKLEATFITKSAEICAFSKEEYEQIRVSVGVAAYDPKIDKTAQDVAIHADHLMYANKRERKSKTK